MSENKFTRITAEELQNIFNSGKFQEIFGAITGAGNGSQKPIYPEFSSIAGKQEDRKHDENGRPRAVGSEKIAYPGYRMEVKRGENGERICLILNFCVPGIDKNQISINNEDGILHVKCSTPIEYFGNLDQSVKVNNLYDLEQVKASLCNGNLKITIPAIKVEKVKPINIEIS